MQKILVISANPKPSSLTLSLAQEYSKQAAEYADVQFLDISTMQFDSDLHHGHDMEQALERDLIQFQEALTWCDHLVLFTPIWWGSIPAKLKGLFDRTLLPGFAFKYVKGKAFPKQLLKGKSARVFALMDTPPWYYRLIQGAPVVKELKKPVLEFVGFRIKGFTMFGPVLHSSSAKQDKWRQQVIKFANKDSQAGNLDAKPSSQS